MNIVKSVTNYFSASWAEIRKITWPTRRQLVRLTILVIVSSIILAVILTAIDYCFEALVKAVITKG